MRKDPIYLIDCDEVLADYVNPALDIIHKLSGKRFKKEDVTQYDILACFGCSYLSKPFWEAAGRKGFCAGFSVMPGAHVGFGKLMKLHGTILVVTSPPETAPSWSYERRIWLRDHFDIPKDHVISTSGKEFISGDCLIDDRPENLLKWKLRNPEGSAILWNACHNHDFESPLAHRVSSWEELIEELKYS